MKKFLKALAVIGSILLALKALQVLVNAFYEQSNQRYVSVNEDQD